MTGNVDIEAEIHACAKRVQNDSRGPDPLRIVSLRVYDKLCIRYNCLVCRGDGQCDACDRKLLAYDRENPR